MEVKLDTRALKDISKIDKSEAIKIFDKIEKLKDFPRVSNYKKLINFQPPFRLRVGDYRVLFDIEDNEIVIFRVKHRRDSYKKRR